MKAQESDFIAHSFTSYSNCGPEKTLKHTDQAFQHYSNSYLRKAQNKSSLSDVIKKSKVRFTDKKSLLFLWMG